MVSTLKRFKKLLMLF
jgi:nicotinamide phosphoribosyltransferase